MSRLFPHMTDSPEHSQTLGGIAYCVFPFLILPFALMLFVLGVRDERPYVILEFLYQAINFWAFCTIFRTYLQDSWFTFGLSAGPILRTCLRCAAGIVLYWLVILAVVMQTGADWAVQILRGAIPITGIELMLLPGQFALHGGIAAVIMLVFLGPVTNACMYYATAFSPLCANGRRLWAYLSLAAMTAAPRIVTYLTVWGGQKEKALYLAQLPIHLLSCWLYQKTNTLWAPILTHAAVNAVCCGLLYLMQFFGFHI